MQLDFKLEKKPKTLSEKDEAWIKRNNDALVAIREREKRYDEFEKTMDFEDPQNEEFIDDLFSSDEWYFIDKKLDNTAYDVSQKHDPNIFLSELYNECQHDSAKAEEAVEDYILPELDSAIANEKNAKKVYAAMEKKYKDKKAKPLMTAKEKNG